MSDAVDVDLPTPCPVCGKQLTKIFKEDGSLFMDSTPYLVFCNSCDFEEDADMWQERLESK